MLSTGINYCYLKYSGLSSIATIGSRYVGQDTS